MPIYASKSEKAHMCTSATLISMGLHMLHLSRRQVLMAWSPLALQH